MTSEHIADSRNLNDFAQFEGYFIKRLSFDMVEINFENGYNGELEDAKLIVKRIGEFCNNGKPILLLAIYAEDNAFSKEAREYIASTEINEIVKAEALVICSLAQRIVGNFYLKINKPPRASRLFNDRALALEWLSNK